MAHQSCSGALRFCEHYEVIQRGMCTKSIEAGLEHRIHTDRIRRMSNALGAYNSLAHYENFL